MNNKRFKKAKLAASAIAILLAVGAFTGCSNPHTSHLQENSKNESSYTESVSQSQGNPFEVKKWKGEEYLTIKEDALRDVISKAMNDAEKFYTGIGAPNMKLDSNNKVIPGKGNFYPDWMNENYFLARAKQESGIFMINYRANISDSLSSDPQGVMQINPNDVVPTLEDYYKNVFGENISLDELKLFPSANDVANFKSSDAQDRILETVYNNVYLSICFDIYATKCLNPGHTDYYAPYGGFSDELRQEAVIAQYLWGLPTISNSMKNGTFKNEYASSKYVSNILKFQKDFSAENQNSNQME